MARSSLPALSRTCVLGVLAAMAACAIPGVDDDAELDSSHAPGGYLGTVTIQYEGSCEFLLSCSSYSRNAGVVSFACGDRGCSPDDRWVAVPASLDHRCGDTVSVCRGERCVSAVVKDVSCCGRWEASHAVLQALGVSHGDNPSTCTGYGEARVSIYEGASVVPADVDGAFNGFYCALPGGGCGGNVPCWADCPSGSACDFAEGDWGYCLEGEEPVAAPAPPEDTEPAPPEGDTFNGYYCALPGRPCGGHEPCWAECPAGSACDFAEGSWGYCLE